MPQEILPLVGAVNSALDRLDEGMQQQREFTANAAHQLRTPLTVLAANIDMMGDTAAAAKLRHDVDLMSRIVTQLLLVARLENLNICIDDPVELNAMVREAAENLGPLAISTQKTLEVDEPTTPVFVRGNTHAVVAAVSNLIENALNHSPPGGAVKIRVTPTPSIEVARFRARRSGRTCGKRSSSGSGGARPAGKAPASDWRLCGASCGRCGATSRLRTRRAGEQNFPWISRCSARRLTPLLNRDKVFPPTNAARRLPDHAGGSAARLSHGGCLGPAASCCIAGLSLCGRLLVSFPSARSTISALAI